MSKSQMYCYKPDILWQDTEVRGQMVVSLKNVSMVSSKLLVTAKHVAADPAAPNAKNQLATAARLEIL